MSFLRNGQFKALPFSRYVSNQHGRFIKRRSKGLFLVRQNARYVANLKIKSLGQKWFCKFPNQPMSLSMFTIILERQTTTNYLSPFLTHDFRPYKWLVMKTNLLPHGQQSHSYPFSWLNRSRRERKNTRKSRERERKKE